MTHRRPQTESELVEFVRSIDVRAPESLHAGVQAMIAQRRRQRTIGDRLAGVFARGLRPRFAAVGAVVAAAAVAIALSVSGPGTSAPSLRDTAALTLLPSTGAAPPRSPMHHATLAAAVQGVSFPYWEDGLGWRSTGTRTDHLNGRSVTTVFYGDGKGDSVGYAIVSGQSPATTTGGTVTVRSGVRYRVLSENGTAVVTWVRDGHMCVVSGRGVSAATLVRLASWHAPAAA
jgi:hypothetical protein